MHERAKKGWKNEHLWTCDMSLMLWYMSLTVLFQSLEAARPWIQAAEGRWFLFSKEELSIRFTLSVDNPNIDHWLNIGNTDHFPHSSAIMLISLNILCQGHQRRKGSNLEARRPMTCYRKYLPGTQSPMMLILNLGCNKEFYKWKK